MKLLSAAAKAALTATLAVTLSTVPPAAYAGDPLLKMTQRQVELLTYAFKVAVHDGHRRPQIVQAILMQETKAGEFMSPYRGKRSIGVCQVQLGAAKDVLKTYPTIWEGLHHDRELEERLALDDKFNVAVCSKYLLMMGVNENFARGITAFNQGLGGMQRIKSYLSFGYTKSVIAYAKKLMSWFKDKPNPIETAEVVSES